MKRLKITLENGIYSRWIPVLAREVQEGTGVSAETKHRKAKENKTAGGFSIKEFFVIIDGDDEECGLAEAFIRGWMCGSGLLVAQYEWMKSGG